MACASVATNGSGECIKSDDLASLEDQVESAHRRIDRQELRYDGLNAEVARISKVIGRPPDLSTGFEGEGMAAVVNRIAGAVLAPALPPPDRTLLGVARWKAIATIGAAFFAGGGTALLIRLLGG